jgi:hypothetical protein
LLPDDENDLFSPERSLLYFFAGLLKSVLSAPEEDLPLDVDLLGASADFEALFDDLPDWSLRLLPGLLNAIVF